MVLQRLSIEGLVTAMLVLQTDEHVDNPHHVHARELQRNDMNESGFTDLCKPSDNVSKYFFVKVSSATAPRNAFSGSGSSSPSNTVVRLGKSRPP